MGYERYGRGDDDRRDDRDGGRRDYRGAGELGYDRPQGRERDRGDYGARDYGQRDVGSQRDYAGSDYARGDYGREGSAQSYGNRAAGQSGWGGDRTTEGFNGGTDYYRGDRGRDRQDRDPRDRGSSQDDRGFMARAGDEVRSWFGDEQAERRREQDARDSERGGHAHYHDWRDQQVQQFDRDYREYHQENRQKFHNEFSAWRTERQGQRDLLGSVREHAEVVGSDGEHVGTVDKVRGDHVILTKKDQDAGGRHHWFPSRWIRSVDDKVTLTKTAADAKREWQDAERYGEDGGQSGEGGGLNRSFSGTY